MRNLPRIYRIVSFHARENETWPPMLSDKWCGFDVAENRSPARVRLLGGTIGATSPMARNARSREIARGDKSPKTVAWVLSVDIREPRKSLRDRVVGGSSP